MPGSYWCYHSAVSCPSRRRSSPDQLSRRPAGAGLAMQAWVSPRWQQPIQSLESATEVRHGEWAAALPGCDTATRPAWLVSLQSTYLMPTSAGNAYARCLMTNRQAHTVLQASDALEHTTSLVHDQQLDRGSIVILTCCCHVRLCKVPCHCLRHNPLL